MSQQHPITPPPELVREWAQNRGYSCADELWDYLAAQAAQWGADQELEACCMWLKTALASPLWVKELCAARRPKPPSLKKQALAVIENSAICDHLSPQDETILRLALEQLDD